MKVLAAPDDIPWLLERLAYVPTANITAIKLVDAAGRIHGMVGFDGWTRGSAFMHVALDTPALCRPLIRAAFEYPFVQVGLRVVLGIINGGNARSLRLATRLGFSVGRRVRDGHAPGVDLVLVEMRREECRWLTSEERKAA